MVVILLSETKECVFLLHHPHQHIPNSSASEEVWDICCVLVCGWRLDIATVEIRHAGLSRLHQIRSIPDVWHGHDGDKFFHVEKFSI